MQYRTFRVHDRMLQLNYITFLGLTKPPNITRHHGLSEVIFYGPDISTSVILEKLRPLIVAGVHPMPESIRIVDGFLCLSTVW